MLIHILNGKQCRSRSAGFLEANRSGWQCISEFSRTRFIVLGFNNTSTRVGHFVSSPGEREKRDRGDSRGDEREGQGRKRNRNESEETEEIKIFPPLPLPATRIAGLAQMEANISWSPGDVRYLTPSPHPTTPNRTRVKLHVKTNKPL